MKQYPYLTIFQYIFAGENWAAQNEATLPHQRTKEIQWSRFLETDLIWNGFQFGRGAHEEKISREIENNGWKRHGVGVAEPHLPVKFYILFCIEFLFPNHILFLS